MELQEAFNNDHTSYLRAFVEVAKILCPTAVYNKIETTTKVTKIGCTNDIRLYGYDKDGTEMPVIVRTYLHPSKGEQIVIDYMNENGNVAYSHSVWYFAFNWKGLQATS